MYIDKPAIKFEWVRKEVRNTYFYNEKYGFVYSIYHFPNNIELIVELE